MSEYNTIPRPALILGLAGLIPFFACSILSIWPDSAYRELALLALGGYGGLILSFLGGVRWGNLLHDSARLQQWIPLVMSVVPTLIAWVALLLQPGGMLLLLIAGFVFQYLLDLTASRRHSLPIWYGRLRLILTSGALLALVMALWVEVSVAG